MLIIIIIHFIWGRLSKHPRSPWCCYNQKAPKTWNVFLWNHWCGNQRPSHFGKAAFFHGSFTKCDTLWQSIKRMNPCFHSSPMTWLSYWSKQNLKVNLCDQNVYFHSNRTIAGVFGPICDHKVLLYNPFHDIEGYKFTGNPNSSSQVYCQNNAYVSRRYLLSLFHSYLHVFPIL